MLCAAAAAVCHAEPPPAEVFQKEFQMPPKKFRIIQYGNPVPEQLKKYESYGMGGFMAFFHNELREESDPRFMADHSLDKISGMLDAAKAADFTVWLADDFGYPSGMAGGKVVENNPEYEVRGLVRLTMDGGGEGPVTRSLPPNIERIVHARLYPVEGGAPDFADGVAVPFDGRTVQTNGRKGAWRLDIYALKVINEGSQALTTTEDFGHSGRYPDLLNADAVASFLKLFHARVAGAAGDLRGRVEGFYTNEPNLMRIHFDWRDKSMPTGHYAQFPWNDQLPGVFQEMHGYDLLPKIGSLFEGDAKEDRRLRMHFQMTVADMLAKNFARQIREWCAARGIRSGGHFLLNEYISMHVAGYGDMMKFVSEFDVPGIDIGIPNPDGIATFPYQQTKFFSSVAAWKERQEVICLPDPIIAGGGMRRLSPAIPLVRNTINMAFLHGADQMTSYLYLDPLDRDGQRGEGYTPEEYRALNEYTGRIAMLLRGARREASVALLYPIRMFQADYKPSNLWMPEVVKLHAARQEAWEQTEHALLDADADYEIVHPEALEQATIQEGCLKIGRGSYRTLVMPQVEILSRAALDKIREFEVAGGKVLWVDEKPQMAESAEDDDAIHQAAQRIQTVPRDQLAAQVGDAVPENFRLEFGRDAPPFGLARFVKDDNLVYYVVNRTEKPMQLPVLSGGDFDLLDPATGVITPRTAPCKLELPALGSLLLVHGAP